MVASKTLLGTLLFLLAFEVIVGEGDDITGDEEMATSGSNESMSERRKMPVRYQPRPGARLAATGMVMPPPPPPPQMQMPQMPLLPPGPFLGSMEHPGPMGPPEMLDSSRNSGPPMQGPPYMSSMESNMPPMPALPQLPSLNLPKLDLSAIKPPSISFPRLDTLLGDQSTLLPTPGPSILGMICSFIKQILKQIFAEICGQIMALLSKIPIIGPFIPIGLRILKNIVLALISLPIRIGCKIISKLINMFIVHPMMRICSWAKSLKVIPQGFDPMLGGIKNVLFEGGNQLLKTAGINLDVFKGIGKTAMNLLLPK